MNVEGRAMRRRIFFLSWIFATTGFGWLLVGRFHTFESPTAIPILIGLLICTIALYLWFPAPVLKESGSFKSHKRGWYLLLAGSVTFLLFLARTAVGPSMLFAWPGIAAVVLVFLKSHPGRKELIYAFVLSIVSGIAALGAEWITLHPAVWAALQAGIVSLGLLASWELLRRSGLWQAGIGRSRLLDRGIAPALKRVLSGIALAMPWALGGVLMGSADSETWVKVWWQPFVAINPGIAEEVWGRLLPVPLMFLFFKKAFRPRTAYLGAMLIMNYWFAYLHTSGGLSGLITAALIGTVFTLPLSILCFHRDLETAMGFHFWIDFVKFLAALFLNTGIWFL